MISSAFLDKNHHPGEKDLEDALGRSKGRWDDLVSHLSDTYSPLTEKWQYGGARYGWCLRMIRKKRTILYMTPCEKHALVGIVLGEKAVARTEKLDLEPDTRKVIEDAPRYGEGRGFRITLRTKKDLDEIRKVAEAKMST